MSSNVEYLNFQREVQEAIAEDGGVPEAVASVEILETEKPSKFGNLPGPGPGRRKVPDKKYVPGSFKDNELFNEVDLPPSWYRYKSEKYEHRLIAYMKVRGMNGVQIAEELGISKITVYTVLKQPWVRELILSSLKDAGRDGIQELLHGTAIDNFQFLIDVRDNDKAQTRDRIAAANALLDRTYGKPNQPVTHREEVDLTKLSDEELAKVVCAGGRGN
jgi:hypothetical protein